MHKMKALILLAGLSVLTACQSVPSNTVNYNGVREDVATWINNQPLMSVQQKRSLVQLSKAQQQIKAYPEYDQAKKLAVTRENQIALHCARLHDVTEPEIQQLQQQIYAAETQAVFNQYEQLAPKIKLDPKSIQCDS